MVKSRSVERNAKNAKGLPPPPPPFPSRSRLIFALLVLIRPHYILSERLAQAKRARKNKTAGSVFSSKPTRAPGDSHMKGVGMLVVSLRGVNFGFWSHLGCSGQNAIRFSSKGLF